MDTSSKQFAAIAELPEMVAMFGHVKTAAAVQTLYDADHLNEEQARQLLRRLSISYYNSTHTLRFFQLA